MLFPSFTADHAGAAAEMCNDHASAGKLRFERAQFAHNVLEGKAMKAVAKDALVIKTSRQRIHARNFRKRAVKRRVEARHLRQIRKFPGDELNSSDRRWHVIGIQWHKLLDLREELRSDPLWVLVSRSPMHEPVTRSRQSREKAAFAQPRKHYFQGSIPDGSAIDRGVEQRVLPLASAIFKRPPEAPASSTVIESRQLFMVASFIEGRLQSRRPSVHG